MCSYSGSRALIKHTALSKLKPQHYGLLQNSVSHTSIMDLTETLCVCVNTVKHLLFTHQHYSIYRNSLSPIVCSTEHLRSELFAESSAKPRRNHIILYQRPDNIKPS